MIGQLLNLSGREAKARAAELLAWFDLADAADRMAKNYSGGMRRRLDLAASLVGRPSVIFLDEPTTGLDPAKREDMWDVIRSLVTEGSTVLLTTQYLEEADALADQISVIDHGRVIAHDTPDGLEAGRRRLPDRGPARPTPGGWATPLRCWPGSPATEPEVSGRGRLTVPVTGEEALPVVGRAPRGRADRGHRAVAAPAEPGRGLPDPDRPAGGRGRRPRPARTVPRRRSAA